MWAWAAVKASWSSGVGARPASDAWPSVVSAAASCRRASRSCLVSAAAGWVGGEPFGVVGGGRVAVERVEGVVGAHVAEEVLLVPTGEHGVRDRGGIGVGAGGDDLGLVAAGGVESGDLAGCEAPLVRVVGETDAAVGEQVVVGASGLVGVVVFDEAGPGFDRGGTFAVGEDLEPGEVRARRTASGTSRPGRNRSWAGRRDRPGPGSWWSPRAAQPVSDAPGGVAQTSTPSPLRSQTQVSTSARIARRIRATWALGTSAAPW